VEDGREHIRAKYRLAQTISLLGEHQGDVTTLSQAIETYESLLAEGNNLEGTGIKKAFILDSYAQTLKLSGEREGGTKKLDQAVVAYREALEEWTREDAPLDWAGVQMNLAMRFWLLGKAKVEQRN